MSEYRSQDIDPQIDEAVWKAWITKNELKDQISYARRKKLLGFLILGVFFLLVWRLIT